MRSRLPVWSVRPGLGILPSLLDWNWLDLSLYHQLERQAAVIAAVEAAAAAEAIGR